MNKRSESDSPVLKTFDSSPSPQINLLSSDTSEFDRILLTNLTINGGPLVNNNVNHFEQNQQPKLQNNKMSISSTFAPNVIQQQHHLSNSSAVNFFIDDDDLGFDPFEGFLLN